MRTALLLFVAALVTIRPPTGHARDRDREHPENSARRAHAEHERERDAEREPAEEARDEREEDHAPDEEDVSMAMGFLKENLPRLHKGMLKAREEGEDFAERMEEVVDDIEQYHLIKTHDPETAEALLKSRQLEERCDALAEKIRDAKGKPREEMTAELRGLLSKTFDLRLREPEFELKRLEQEVAEVKALIEKRKANKERIVEHRLNELIGAEDIEWW